MTPKSKYDINIVNLQSQLPAITQKQIDWGAQQFTPLSVIHQNKYYCLECGHIQKEATSLINRNRIVCPACKKKSKPHVGKLGYQRTIELFKILTTFKGYQVNRIIYMYKWVKKGQPATYQWSENLQHWIDEKGKITSFTKNVYIMSHYYDNFNINSELELRKSMNHMRYNIDAVNVYPRKSILPILKRNGFVEIKTMKTTSHHLMSRLLKDPKIETLMKAKQYNLVDFYATSNSIGDIWNTIKICIRNNYIVRNVMDWKDYIYLLNHFNKDLLNPKYVCPADLHAEHQRYLEKKRISDRKNRLRELMSKIAEDNEEYVKMRKKFFDLVLQMENITITPITSVQECYDIGSKLNHCVFENKYYKKPESLLLNATIDDVPVETIEVDLKKLKIVQARGANNKPSEYNEKIVSLVTSNIQLIKKLNRSKLKKSA